MTNDFEEEYSKLSENLFFIPILVNIFGNLIDSIGWCLQKRSHLHRLQSISNKKESFIQDKYCGLDLEFIPLVQ